MTIIVFLVDTSASMNQRTYMGTTMLDVAKGAVETFMKVMKQTHTNCFVAGTKFYVALFKGVTSLLVDFVDKVERSEQSLG